MDSMERNSAETNNRYAVGDLIAFAQQLLERSGLDASRASIVAEILVEGDLLGHSTHGLHMLPSYLKQLQAQTIQTTGEPTVLSDHGSAVLWDGNYLPGPWLVVKALNLCFDRTREHPVVTLVIRRSHHIGCLSAYLCRATERGLMLILMSSNPSGKTVAPFGGIVPLYTPDPVAVGIPTDKDPILIDISMSCTSNQLVERYKNMGEKLPHPWLMDNRGDVSDDPAVLSTNPPGSVLPLGGSDLGYKGFALGLMVEALTSGLGGYGRAQQSTRWGASIFLQVLDPNAFGGIGDFRKETGWFAETCRSSTPRPGTPGVRLPGSRGLKLRAEQLVQGVQLYPSILPSLKVWADQLKVPLPRPTTARSK